MYHDQIGLPKLGSTWKAILSAPPLFSLSILLVEVKQSIKRQMLHIPEGQTCCWNICVFLTNFVYAFFYACLFMVHIHNMNWFEWLFRYLVQISSAGYVPHQGILVQVSTSAQPIIMLLVHQCQNRFLEFLWSWHLIANNMIFNLNRQRMGKNWSIGSIA